MSKTTMNILDFSRLPKYTITNGSVGEYQEPKQRVISDSTKNCKIQTKKNVQMSKPFCTFCYNRRRPASEFKSHFTKTGPEFGAKIVCPLLLSQQCAKCGEIGHTPKYCKSEYSLKCAPNSEHDHFDTSPDRLQKVELWQQPIPPALQSKHQEYVEQFVKPSRIWIIMSGDHKKYTTNFALCQGGDHWIPFEIKPRTPYEQLVFSHYHWMRRNIKNNY
jgi:hypothetical protein